MHSESEKAYKAKEAETRKKKPQTRASGGRISSIPMFLTAALLATCPSLSASMQLPRFLPKGTDAGTGASAWLPQIGTESDVSSYTRFPQIGIESGRHSSIVASEKYEWSHNANQYFPREQLARSTSPRPDPAVRTEAVWGEGQQDTVPEPFYIHGIAETANAGKCSGSRPEWAYEATGSTSRNAIHE